MYASIYCTRPTPDNIKLLALQTLTFYTNVGGWGGYNSLQTFDKSYEPITIYDFIAHFFTAIHVVKTLYPGYTT